LLIENDLKGAAGYSLPPLSTNRIDSLSGNYGFSRFIHSGMHCWLDRSLRSVMDEGRENMRN
jgi:hypothetical protein